MGIVSEFDLLELICEGRNEHCKVCDYMSAPPFSVCEEDSWVAVADVFRAKHIRRLPVLRDGMIVGIVSRHDLMRAIQDARRQIRQELAQPARQISGRQAITETMPAVGRETSGRGA
jgi:signal-transduction protein with cAMP-binding, CBS, and nucleotidyltransferase domain